MKIFLVYLLVSIIIAATYFSCAGYQVSYGVGYGVSSGPYGYGGWNNPRVNVGVYSGGYRGYHGYR